MSNRRASAIGRVLLSALPFVVSSAAAQEARPDTVVRLPELRARVVEPTVPRPVLEREILPVTASVTAGRVAQTVNILDVQDAVKYLPSLFARKRNNGDTQSTLAARSWGVGSSARSLVVADGVPLTALIANNNTIGGPRWGLVSPEEIARVDVMQGPFSAAYAGNSMGAVVEITTRQPERFEGSISRTQAVQRFSPYGTRPTCSAPIRMRIAMCSAIPPLRSPTGARATRSLPPATSRAARDARARSPRGCRIGGVSHPTGRSPSADASRTGRPSTASTPTAARRCSSRASRPRSSRPRPCCAGNPHRPGS
jgi:hypothetical protein